MEIKTNSRWVYYTTEHKGVWQLCPDTQTAREQAIRQGAMFFTWNSFSEPVKSNGKEPVRYGDMPLDFDHKEDPGKALQEVSDLCLIHLPELYGVDPYEIEFYCSGSKGFHAVIPAILFGAENGDPYLPHIYKRIVQRWADQFELKTIDLSMYAMGKGKMFRIANIKRSNGRYKVPLTLEEIQKGDIDEVWNLITKSRYL